MNWTTGFRDRTKLMSTTKKGRTEISRKRVAGEPEGSLRPVPQASLTKCRSLDLGLDIFDSIRTSTSKTEPPPTLPTNKGIKLVDLEYHEKMRGRNRNYRLIEIGLTDSPQPLPSKLRLSSQSPAERNLFTGSTNLNRPAGDYKHSVEKPSTANGATEQQSKIAVHKRHLEASDFIDVSMVPNKQNNTHIKSQSTQTLMMLTKDAEVQTDIVLTGSSSSFFRNVI